MSSVAKKLTIVQNDNEPDAEAVAVEAVVETESSGPVGAAPEQRPGSFEIFW